jgi:hypothetical protein
MRKLLIALVLTFGSSNTVAAPPKVVKAAPDNGDVNVDPQLKEIRVTFDQPMGKGMSVVGGGPEFPEVQGRPEWVNNRTIAIKVKLKPNHDYWLSINNEKFRNFTNLGGDSAEPYPIKFRTGRTGAAKKDATAPGSNSNAAQVVANRRAIDAMRTAIRDDYSYRDRLSIDWDNLIKTSEVALLDTKTPSEFAQLAATSLARAKDKHIWLQVGEETVSTYVNPSVPNANYKLLPTLVPNFQKHGRLIASGRWPDGIGYIAITTWDRAKLEDGAPIFEALKQVADTKALILDVRINGGGAEPLAQQFAGCFTSEPRLYAKNVYRDAHSATGFTTPKERWLQPNTRQTKYSRPVALLIGPAVMSSCESFVLMMKQVPGTILVGAKTPGSSGNPKPHDLGNGVTLLLPSWKDLTSAGQELEGIGIAPDIQINTAPSDFQENDPVLTAALEKLRRPAGQ